MTAQRLCLILLALWVVVFAWSIVGAALEPRTGDGFARGLNRVATFFGWQIAAGVVSIFVWWFGRQYQAGSLMRWVSRLPMAFAALLIAAVVGLILWANFGRVSVGESGDHPTTAPAQTVTPKAEPAITPQQ